MPTSQSLDLTLINLIASGRMSLKKCSATHYRIYN